MEAWQKFKRIIFRLGDEKNDIPYLVRYRIHFFFFTVFVHKFLSGDHTDPHDHPWPFLTLILKGGYKEHIVYPEKTIIKNMRPGRLAYRQASHIHRVELHVDETGREIPAWTIIIHFKKLRTWGFHTPDGFINWKKYEEYKLNKS